MSSEVMWWGHVSQWCCCLKYGGSARWGNRTRCVVQISCSVGRVDYVTDYYVLYPEMFSVFIDVCQQFVNKCSWLIAVFIRMCGGYHLLFNRFFKKSWWGSIFVYSPRWSWWRSCHQFCVHCLLVRQGNKKKKTSLTCKDRDVLLLRLVSK